MQKQIIESLQKLGLTAYEAQVYNTLNNTITSTATEISTNSEVPRSKVYNVLKRLNEKGYIEIEKGRPIKYTVNPANDIFKKEKEKLIKQLNETEKILMNNYENQIQQVEAPMWLIHNQDKIIKRELEIISRTKKTLNMRIGYLFPEESEKIKKTINKLPPNIEINILAPQYCYINKEKINLHQELKHKKINIKKANIPQAKVIIRDKIEMLHIFSKFTQKQEIIPKTSIGIWNQYKDIVKNYDERFNKQFHKKNKHKLILFNYIL